MFFVPPNESRLYRYRTLGGLFELSFKGPQPRRVPKAQNTETQ